MKSSRRLRWLAAGLVAGAVVGAAVTRARERGGDSGWYRTVYRFFYRSGLKLWDTGVPAGRLVDLVEGPSPLAPGRALDLGSGTGTNSVYLAGRGWDVTGVDMVPEAIAEARAKAAAAGVAPSFVQGDVTRLEELGIDGGYSLLVDIGCFHTLPETSRDAYAEGVTRAADPGATLLMLGFPYGTMAPTRVGVSPEEMRARFQGWELEEAVRMDRSDLERHLGTRPPAASFASIFRPWWFLLRRRR
jgi:SAM-dependent methyltransferase